MTNAPEPDPNLDPTNEPRNLEVRPESSIDESPSAEVAPEKKKAVKESIPEIDVPDRRRRPATVGKLMAPPNPYPFMRAARDCFAISMGSVILIVLLILVTNLLGVKVVSDAAENSIESVSEALGEVFGGCKIDCGPEYTVNPSIIIQQIEQQSWLEGARATNNFPALQVIKDRPGPTGTGSMRYNAFVTVTSGVDLALLSEGSIEVNGGDVVITLPSPQIRDCILDEQNSFYYDRQCEIIGFSVECGDLENELRKQALVQTADAEHTDLLQEAFIGVSNTLRGIIREIDGVERVNFRVSEATTPVFSGDGTCVNHATPPETLTITPEAAE